MKLSARSHWAAQSNRLTLAREQRAFEQLPILDLTESNPTRAGFDYPKEQLKEILARATEAPYDPDPRGLHRAREALAAELSARGQEVSPEDLILTASTSEAYSFLFKLLGNPGDEIVTPIPSYPLLDHLTELEALRLVHFPMELSSGRWSFDFDAARRALSSRTRAMVVVYPNNPTGTYLSHDEQNGLRELARTADIALISDEVFFDYPFSDKSTAPRSLAGTGIEPLTFCLGGLSKSAALPHWKLGWIQVSGPQKQEALAALEIISDTFLSVSTPVQHALPEILPIGKRICAEIRKRLVENLETLRSELAPVPALELFPVEGGWSAVIRAPRLDSDEDLALALLNERGVLVHPGYFFDFPSEGFFVVSLLSRPETFREGTRAMASYFAARTG